MLLLLLRSRVGFQSWTKWCMIRIYLQTKMYMCLYQLSCTHSTSTAEFGSRWRFVSDIRIVNILKSSRFNLILFPSVIFDNSMRKKLYFQNCYNDLHIHFHSRQLPYLQAELPGEFSLSDSQTWVTVSSLTVLNSESKIRPFLTLGTKCLKVCE